jgi:hypothetical protein
MKVIELSKRGVSPAKPELATSPRGQYWRFSHGEQGRGRKLVFFPLGARDFPGSQPAPDGDQDYDLIPVSEGRAHILVRGRGRQEGFLVLLSLDPGFRGSATYEVSGAAELLAEGYEAQGDAGRAGGAPCPVLRVTGPCVVRWSRSGRLYGDHPDWVAVYDGDQWVVRPDDPQYAAEEAAFTAPDGEVQS